MRTHPPSPLETVATTPTFGRYRVVRRVGEGAMGSVFEAEHLDLGRRVALKVLRPEHVVSEESVRRFLREGRATSQLKHPNAVETYDVGFDNHSGWLVMEFLDGETLAQRLEREKRLDPTAAVDLLLPVISAVGSAHALGIVHRDLKPSNVVLARGAFGEVTPKVVDFGISKLLNEPTGAENELTGNAAMLGTPMYMPPEQIRGARRVGPASDQYALGVMLYRLVTGAAPFEGRDMYEMLSTIMKGVHVRPRVHVPTLRPELEAVIGRAMQREAGDRFVSLKAFAEALLPFASPAMRAAWGPRFEAMPAPHLTPALGVESLSDTPRLTLRPRAPARSSLHREASSALTVALAVIGVALIVLGALWWSRRPTLAARHSTQARPAAETSVVTR
ncbi:MAG: serine/threonine protein kinase [Myxococcales bacterium]|nr:serine/threonine protein kinase [Myxococcales bacterium]